MNKQYLLLPEDRVWLDRRISELEKEISDLGPDFYEVFNQSSETWHDNAPFEALRDKQSVMFAELTKLKEIRFANTLSLPKRKSKKADVNRIVHANNKRYLIAGDWSYRSGATIEGITVITRNTPIAQAFIGQTIGASTQFGDITAIE